MKPSPHYVITESTISGCDIVLLPGLLPIFLHGCEIKSGWGLGTRLIRRCVKIEGLMKAPQGTSMYPSVHKASLATLAFVRIVKTNHDIQCHTLHLVSLPSFPIFTGSSIEALYHSFGLQISVWLKLLVLTSKNLVSSIVLYLFKYRPLLTYIHLTSTYMMNAPKPSPFFACLPLPCIIVNANETGEAWERGYPPP